MLTEEQIEAIENCGGAEMSLDETCMIAGCTMQELQDDEAARVAFQRGRLKTRMNVRQSLVKLAISGDLSAAKLVLDLDFMQQRLDAKQLINQ